MPVTTPADPVPTPVQREKVHVNLPVDVLNRLRKIGAAEGEPWAAIMRRILRQGLDQQGHKP